jgi:hypothetical protein
VLLINVSVRFLQCQINVVLYGCGRTWFEALERSGGNSRKVIFRKRCIQRENEVDEHLALMRVRSLRTRTDTLRRDALDLSLFAQTVFQ